MCQVDEKLNSTEGETGQPGLHSGERKEERKEGREEGREGGRKGRREKENSENSRKMNSWGGTHELEGVCGGGGGGKS